MVEFALIGSGAAIAGLIIGALTGAWIANRRLRRHYEDVRSEVARLRRVAEDKLSGDDPNLDALLRDLHAAAEQAFKTVEALESQGRTIKRKTDGGKEIIASSRHIIRMIDEFAGAAREPAEPAATPKLTKPDAANKKPQPRLR